MPRLKPAEEVTTFGTIELKEAILKSRGPTDPLYLAIHGLPERVSRDQYLTAPRVLLPLARLREA